MIAQLSGAVFNIIFDPILIFGVPALGIPRLEIAGAAIATVGGQHVAAVVGILLNLKKNKEIHFSLKKILKPEGRVVGRIYKVGVPSILMMSVGSVMNFLLNKILISFTETATAVFGAYFKMQSFFFMPLFGMNNGLVPIMAYNYGARNRKRIMDVLRFAVMLAIIRRSGSSARTSRSPRSRSCSARPSSLCEEHLLADRVAPQTDRRADPRSLHSGARVQGRRRGLVQLPHRGSCLSHRRHHFLQKAQEGHHRQAVTRRLRRARRQYGGFEERDT